MNLDFNLKLTQEQKLIMTQQMQLSIKMLQMSGSELQQYIQKELQENPVLDATYKEDNSNEYIKDKIDYKKFIEYLQFDNYSSKGYINTEDEEVSPFNFISNEKSLKDFLEEQIIELNEDKYIKEICMYIVENLDDKGYLDNNTENMSKEINAKKEDVERCLKIIQSLEPSGIGCRDLKECLKIQLINKKITNEKIFLLVENYLELLAENKISDIAKKLDISVIDAQKYADIIRNLEPKPSRGFYTGENVKYIIPDAYIKKINGKYHIIMNDSMLPMLNINSTYKNIILEENNKSKSKDETIEYVKDKINSAVFLIKSIEHRKSTIYKVLEEIIKIQKDFFDYGKEYLKPMTLKEIASGIDVHESTVSRAIRDKYIHTNRGTIKIKDLFSTAVSSRVYGEDISVIKIKNKIEGYINNENKKKPLSDQRICDMLIKEGMNISRRTVAKYREELGIKSSSKRKRF